MRDPITLALAERYRRFADEEAQGRSPLYAALSRGVAGDAELLGFLLSLPEAKRQPNLLLAAVRAVAGTAQDYPDFRARFRAAAPAIRALILARSTQTNEPARCAVLLPVLARLPQPLALLEIGASAGLCLLPDFYGYDYGQGILRGARAGADAPVFACAASQATPLPASLPQIAWRAGLDLNPLDAGEAAQAAWLEALVWPEQAGRLAGLRSALRLAAAQRPRVVAGDLTGGALEALCRQAPAGATLVVFHTAVLAYVPDQAERQRVATRLRDLCPYWICNEAPATMPELARRAGAPGGKGRFLMSVNGVPIAWTDPHGAAIDWIGAVA
jgi:hypothetical protein